MTVKSYVVMNSVSSCRVLGCILLGLEALHNRGRPVLHYAAADSRSRVRGCRLICFVPYKFRAPPVVADAFQKA